MVSLECLTRWANLVLLLIAKCLPRSTTLNRAPLEAITTIIVVRDRTVAVGVIRIMAILDPRSRCRINHWCLTTVCRCAHKIERARGADVSRRCRLSNNNS